MVTLQHKFDKLSYSLKILSFISLITIIANVWNIYTFYPIYYGFIERITFFEYFVSFPLQYLLFFIAVFISGFLNYQKILYLFPVIAYYILISKICYLVSNNEVTHLLRSSLPSQFEAILTIILLIVGMVMLPFFYKKRVAYIKPSLQIAKNMRLIALSAYIVLVIMSWVTYQSFDYFLEKTFGKVAEALNYAGLVNLILLGLICIFGLKKWPSILWLFPFMGYSFTWPYLKGLLYNPADYILPLQVATILLTILTVLGLYTLYLWIRQLIDVTKSQ